MISKLLKRIRSKEELTPEDILERATTTSELIEAKAKAHEKLEQARKKKPIRNFASFLVGSTGPVLLVAAIAIILAGYLYDFKFFAAQSDVLIVVIGLLVFGFVARTCAWAISLALNATREDATDDEGPLNLKNHIGISPSMRRGLKVMWFVSIGLCTVATLSFFLEGYDNYEQGNAQVRSQYEAALAEYNLDKADAEEEQNTRIDETKERYGRAKNAYDTAVSAANDTIAGTEDNIAGRSNADNKSIQDADASKRAAKAAYDAAIAAIDADLKAIRAEGLDIGPRPRLSDFMQADESGVVRHTAAPFATVYRLFANMVGAESVWAKIGAVCFAFAFEYFCVRLIDYALVIMKVSRRVARYMLVQNVADETTAQITMDKLEASVELKMIALNGEKEQARLQAQIEETRLESQRKVEEAQAEIDRARNEREAEKARAHAQALREGKPFVDPDDLINAQADRLKAMQEAKMRELNEIAERLRKGELSINDVDEDGNLKLTATELRTRKSEAAKKLYNEARGGAIPLPERFEWSTEQ